jgi:hypothetical protein
MSLETAEQAETRIHGEWDLSQMLDKEQREDLYKEKPVGDDPQAEDYNPAWFHPLTDPFVTKLKATEPDDPPTGTERCWADCKERERIRRKECAEVRKRVAAKLKEMGCVSAVTSTEKPIACSDRRVPKYIVGKQKQVSENSRSGRFNAPRKYTKSRSRAPARRRRR